MATSLLGEDDDAVSCASQYSLVFVPQMRWNKFRPKRSDRSVGGFTTPAKQTSRESRVSKLFSRALVGRRAVSEIFIICFVASDVRVPSS